MPNHPAYLKEDSVCSFVRNLSVKKFFMLDFNTWPTKEELNFNESQYEAYKVALTHEFAVIQGPPGTGKTYLGVKVAKTLLNLNVTDSRTDCTILLVCYTNHALDQFLEALLSVTDRIVRIGGQSRNSCLDLYNLNILRKQNTSTTRNDTYINLRRELQSLINIIKDLNFLICCLDAGVLESNVVARYVPDINIIRNYYYPNTVFYSTDLLLSWLFENMVYNLNENIKEIELYVNEENEVENLVDDIKEVILDDFEIDDDKPHSFYYEGRLSFSLEKSKRELRNYLKKFKIARPGPEKQKLNDEIIQLRAKTKRFEVS